MQLRWRRHTLHCRHRFATARGGIDEKQVLFVELEHQGIVGHGECVPSALYGQSLESSEQALAGLADLLADDPLAIEPILRNAVQQHGQQRAAIAALDGALHDWAGQRLDLPVWRLLGLSRPAARTTFTIGVASPDEVRTKTAEAVAEGYDALKVKVGVASDQENLAIIREQFAGPLLLDANEAWQPDEAADRIRALAPFRPTLIEQPLSRGQEAACAPLRALGVAPIFVDESCQRPQDIAGLVGHVDGINIKLTKCGGIREALRMIWTARALGLGVMLGCFVSSSLAIAPALTIASLVDYCDLDGHLLLADDPYRGIERTGSRLSLSDAPGLGVARASQD